MRNRRLAKLATGLAVGAAAIGMTALPVSATTDTEDADITAGTMELYDEFFGFIDDVDLGATGNTCSTTSSSMTMNDTPNPDQWSADLNSDSAIAIGGNNFRVVLAADLAGTYAGGGLSGTGSAVATVQRTVGTGSCVADTNYGPCTIEAVNISVSGTYDVPTAPDINPALNPNADSATVSGGNTPGNFETQVSSTDPDDCGSLIALNNGGVTLDDVKVTAIV